ncbi:MAG TPA: helical backbone metal receptor [Gemmatimonadales bacterium]|nr:helical backbone metal receptor [Gemmatimonadales bacterium]
MRRWAQRTHLAVLLALAVPACGGGGSGGYHRSAPAGAIAVSDDAGRRVTLAQPARRIVSLSPAVTELLFALGAGERVVGRTTWCDYPPAARAVPSVGDGLNPNLEAVAARQPDLVVLYRSPLNETAAQQLTRLGVAAVIVRQDRLEDLARAARLLGRLVGRQAAGDSLADALARLVATPAPASHARVAFVAWDNPPIVIGRGSYLDQLAMLAGAENAFHDIGAASATVGLETIAQRDPDAIVVLRDSASPEPPGFARRAEWQVIRAVRQGRFVYLTGSLFGRPGPRAATAAAELRHLLEALTPGRRP